jgi:hypothetical protein
MVDPNVKRGELIDNGVPMNQQKNQIVVNLFWKSVTIEIFKINLLSQLARVLKNVCVSSQNVSCIYLNVFLYHLDKYATFTTTIFYGT